MHALKQFLLSLPASFQNTNMTHKINDNALILIEQCQISPPPASLPSITLPLTFLDIPWVTVTVPVQRIFFYEYPHPTQHFLQTALPILKHSLSLTLQHFFPLASNLIIPPELHLSYIRYLDGDSLTFTVAESTADFILLTSDSPQDVRNWHPLVPSLSPPRAEQDGTHVFPLMAIQVTILPNSGFTISFTFHHVVCDGRALHHFIKFWASVCKAKGNMDLASLESSSSLSLPSHERDNVKDPKGLKLIYLHELEHNESKNMKVEGIVRDVSTTKVRSTFVLSREQVNKLKKWVSLKCVSNDLGVLHISTFVVTCSLIWVCMNRSEQSKDNNSAAQDNDELCYMVFLADIRDTPEVSLPSTYFGNCLASCSVGIKRSEIMKENGIVEVVKVIERKVRDLKSDPFTKAETLMSDYRELWKPGKSVVVIAGSPKFNAYQTDFGWGKPKKSDAAHIDVTGVISLSDCRYMEGGIEVGLAFDKIRMSYFTNILEQQLNIIVCE